MMPKVARRDSILAVSTAAATPPDDVAALKIALLAATARASQVEAELATAKARASDDQALIAHQQLQIAKLQQMQVFQKRHTF